MLGPVSLYARILTRAQRYAAMEERLISPEGAFTAIGRSLSYRIGAFQFKLWDKLRCCAPLPKADAGCPVAAKS